MRASVTLPLWRTWFATDGSNRSSAAAATVPTSASVSVTVFRSRWNTAACTSRTARTNSALNAVPPTTVDTTCSMIGRAAIRSACCFSTTWSVTRCATSVRTLSSRSVADARPANWFESNSARRA